MMGDRDSAVGIVTSHGLDGPVSNLGRCEIFSPVQTCPGAHPQWVTGLFQG